MEVIETYKKRVDGKTRTIRVFAISIDEAKELDAELAKKGMRLRTACLSETMGPNWKDLYLIGLAGVGNSRYTVIGQRV